MPKGYWIVSADVTDAEKFEDYKRFSTEAALANGGRFLARGGSSKVIEGSARSRNVIVEYPSYEAALAAYDTEAYKIAKASREGGADFNIVVLEGTE